MLYEDFAKEIERKRPLSCYQISGEDAYWTRLAYEKLISLADSIDIVKAAAPEGIEDTLFSLGMFPMLGEYKIAVLDGYEKFNANDKKRIIDYINNPVEGAILILYNCEPLNNKNIEKCIFSNLSEGELIPVIIEAAIKKNANINKDAARLLAGYAENDMSIISNELCKLIAYAGKDPITVRMVKECVTPNITYSVYQFAEAVANGDYEKAYRILHSLTNSYAEYSRYLSNITTYYRTVFYAKISALSDFELAAFLKTREFAVKKARWITKKYMAIELLELLKLLYRLEYEFKSGKISVENALELAIAEAIERRIK